MAKTIMIVEDNELNMKLFNDLLESRGYSIVQTRNGMEALDLARAHHPDLILMDIQLPKISGMEATRRLRADASTANTPIITITSFALAGDEQKAKEAGATAYLVRQHSTLRATRACPRCTACFPRLRKWRNSKRRA